MKLRKLFAALAASAVAEKAKTLLGWEATHTVEDMCRSAWNFAKNASGN